MWNKLCIAIVNILFQQIYIFNFYKLINIKLLNYYEEFSS